MSTAADFTVAPQTELAPWAEEALKQQEEAPQVKDQAAQDTGGNDVLLFQIPALAAGDAEGLANIIIHHPDLYEQILTTAASFLGNDTVTRALDIVHGGTTQAEAAKAQEPAAEETPADVVAQQAAEHSCGVCKGEACVCDAPKEEIVEPGWVVRARAFNAKHPDEVQLFNHATGYQCVGPNGEPDPNAVANWQANHGVKPDGRIGKETADVAWSLMPVEAPKEHCELPADLPPPQ
jgi:hypothetical protein